MKTQTLLIYFFFSLLVSFSCEASTRSLKIEDDGFVATYYSSASQERKVGVLVLGGSEGGVPEKLASPIVEAGFPTLALAYFKEEGLPPELERIPLEYVIQAMSWLKSQPETTPDNIIVVGWSKGAELSLLLASKEPSISNVVAIAPSSVVWAGILKDWSKVPGSSWTYDGQDLTFVPFNPSGEVNGLLDLYTQSLENRADNGKANIPVQKISADVVLMTGENDEIWPSPTMAETVCEKMNARTKHKCKHINYQGADHLLNYEFLKEGSDMNQTFIKMLTNHNNH